MPFDAVALTHRVTAGETMSFSVIMGLTALAPTPEVFGLLRFLGGLGLGDRGTATTPKPWRASQ